MLAGLTLIVQLIAVVDVPVTFALGELSPSIFVGASNYTQKINAGEATLFDMWVTPDWADWFNLTVGSSTILEVRREEHLYAGPLPEGIKVVYPSRIYVLDPFYAQHFPLTVEVSPDIIFSTINLTIIASGIYRHGEKYYNDMIWGWVDIQLYVEPWNTSLGVASTVFWEGFDRLRLDNWTLLEDGGSVDIPDNPAVNQFRLTYLRFIDFGYRTSVAAEKLIPRMNGSFILEFSMMAETIQRFPLKFRLLDSTLGDVISVEFSEGNILVNNATYGQYDVRRWYIFRFEAYADISAVKVYVDDEYLDILLWRGSPDMIRVETSDSGIGRGGIDDIFIQKIWGTPILTSTTTVTETKTATKLATIKISVTSTKTSTTTLSTTITNTSTATSIEEVTDPSIYAWAIIASVMVAILGAVLIWKKRS